MEPLRAHVKNARLVLDEPTDLPEGEVVCLVPAVEADLDDSERDALEASLRESVDEMRGGRLIDAADALRQLRDDR
jgi:hypothetical protein